VRRAIGEAQHYLWVSPYRDVMPQRYLEVWL
jgi:hypothetical protein